MLKKRTTKCLESQESLHDAWGTFLTDLGDANGGWDWWATLTFRDPAESSTNPGWTKIGWQYSKRAFRSLVNELRDLRGLGEPTWVRGMEYQQFRGVPHFHCLMGGVSHLRRDEVWQWWFEKYGQARIEPYNRELGAGWYLCKYVSKEFANVDFSENLTNLKN